MNAIRTAKPTGKAFDNEICRAHLANALFAIGNQEESMPVMASDAEMAVVAETQYGERDKRLINSYASLGFLARIPTKESFAALSRIGTKGLAGERMESTFKRVLGVDYQTSKKLFDAWQSIAAKDW